MEKEMKVQHTPGPWYAENSRRISNSPDTDNIGDSYRLIAFTAENNFLERGEAEIIEANARLIAAAPELLEALKYAAAKAFGWPGYIFNPATDGEMRQKAADALKKAEGRS